MCFYNLSNFDGLTCVTRDPAADQRNETHGAGLFIQTPANSLWHFANVLYIDGTLSGGQAGVGRAEVIKLDAWEVELLAGILSK